MNSNTHHCLREPIPEIFEAARLLDAAVTAHTMGCRELAAELFRMADIPEIAEWSESLWGKGGPWTQPMNTEVAAFVPKEERHSERMPTTAEKRELIERDGRHCRFCGIPLVRSEVRTLLHKAYPEVVRWGARNSEQHAGLQAMWLQFDHLLPHARGGSNDLDNLIVTCAPCNNGRSNLTLEEVGLSDPRLRSPKRSTWDGLERVMS